LRRAEGGAKIFGVFHVKNHDFTPKNLIIPNFRGGARRVRPPLIAIKNYHPYGFLVPSLNADSFTLLVWLIKTSRLVMFVWKEILICPEHQLSLVRFVVFYCLVAFHHVWF
jgi:hypothetical protein